MIPAELLSRLKVQAIRNPRVYRSPTMLGDVEEALRELNLEVTDDIGEFFLKYRMDAITPVIGFPRQLLDICEPIRHVAETTEFARNVFGLSEDMVCLDTAEGEGYIVYSRKTRSVYEGGFPEVQEINEGRRIPTWNTFVDLMAQYVA